MKSWFVSTTNFDIEIWPFLVKSGLWYHSGSLHISTERTPEISLIICFTMSVLSLGKDQRESNYSTRPVSAGGWQSRKGWDTDESLCVWRVGNAYVVNFYFGLKSAEVCRTHSLGQTTWQPVGFKKLWRLGGVCFSLLALEWFQWKREKKWCKIFIT